MPPRHSAADAGLRRAWPVALVLVALLAIPAPAAAQRDRFYSAVVAFYRSLGALYGDEGPQVLAHLATMTTALARWDRDILDAERELRLRLQTAGDSQTQLEIHTTLASLYIERGRLSDARREIDETIRIDPARAGLHRLRGLVLQMEARDGDAAAEFRAAWLLDPGDPQNAYRAIAYKAAATTTAETERARETLTNLEGALIARDRPAAPAPFTNLSAINDEAGGGTAFVPAAYATGFSSILRGELDRGVDELRAATVSDPLVHDPAARADAMAGGIAALRRGEVAPAIERLETAVAQAPDSSEAHRVLATAYSIAGDIGRSVLHLHEAVRLQPRDERSRLALAQVLIAVDRSAEAQDELRSGVAALPDAAALRWRLSLVSQAHREEEDRALIRMADLLVLLVGKGDLDRELAGLAHLQRDDGTATALLERAVRITPNNATAHKALGRAYVDSGRETEGYAELVAC